PIGDMLAAVGERDSLIIFPEGTRGAGVSVTPFHSGLYRLAQRRPEIELVPVYLDGLERVLPKGAHLPVPQRTSVTFGVPLRLEPGECKQAFLDRARAALVHCSAGTDHRF